MAESSRLQGLHHVAKKLMMMGRPALDSVSVRTARPSKSRNTVAGNCAAAPSVQKKRRKAKKMRCMRREDKEKTGGAGTCVPTLRQFCVGGGI